MTPRRVIGAAVALILAAVLFFAFRPRSPEASPGTAPPGARPGDSGTSTATAPGSGASEVPAAPPERSNLADHLNSPRTDIRADLRLVSGLIETFRTNFLQTGNPVGTNAEITAALAGRNRLRLSLIPADHPAINQAGELCDRWGTPFFFHAESATRMEIRSAGPDRKMWNEDDVVFAP